MTKSILIEHDVEARMRDGVILRADVYRPRDSRKSLPVLLQRSPYGKGGSALGFILLAIDRGYAVVIQDTRGRWASDGDGYQFVHEIEDGYDTVEWAAHLPWANGKVGMFGGSYVGYTQWAAATAQPPSLTTIVPFVTFCDPYRICYAGGALALGVTVSWDIGSGAQMALTREQNATRRDELMQQFIEQMDGLGRGTTYTKLPLKDMPLIGKNGVVPFFSELLDHPTHDAYWQRMQCVHERMQVPALHVGGWYDIFTGETVRDFNAVRLNGGSEAARANQRLLMGPWLHGPLEGLVGEVDFGMVASSATLVPDEIFLRWYDFWLKGEKNGIMDEPPVRIFVMGSNQWRNEQEFPLKRTQYTPYYLHSTSPANSLRGGGTLSPVKPGDEAVDSFVYDPHNPVPTRGGNLCCSQTSLAAGAYDQRPVEERPDVLVYTTPVLERDVEVTGLLQVKLWAATNAPDTDFTAKLVDVHSCGYARNIQDGIIRARCRTSTDHPKAIKAGEAYEYTIDLRATSNVFKAGHRIRLEVSSSNFPQYDRNLNTGHSGSESAEMRPALQTIFHDAAHPSHIILPIIPL